MHVEVRSHPGCRNAESVRQLVKDCLRAVGRNDAMTDTVGDYPSPTVLVNGVDVVTGTTEDLRGRACRLDLPTRESVIAALVRA